MSASSRTSPPWRLWSGQDGALRSMRRALLACTAVAAVVVADAGWRMLNLKWFAFVGYSP